MLGMEACCIMGMCWKCYSTPECSRRTVAHNLRLALRSSGLPGHYSGHSFRRATATTARLAGLSEDEIKLLGRWKSDSYRLYIKTHPAYILAASRRQQRVINPFREDESID